MTAAKREQLNQINARVNEAIWPESDLQHYGRPEYWTIPADGFGDCDDYALTKRKTLIDAGFPMRALRIAVAFSEATQLHAVLVVVTNAGDFVLDNLNDDLIERSRTSYVWLMQQDAGNPRAWHAFNDAVPRSQQTTAAIK